MKHFPDKQTILDELRELPEFPLNQKERYDMYETIKKGVNRQQTNRRFKRLSISLAGLATVAVLAIALVKPMGTMHQGAADLPINNGQGTVSNGLAPVPYKYDLWYQAQVKGVAPAGVMQQTQQIMQKRLSLTDAAQGSVQWVEGTAQIHVQLPAVNDLDQVKKMISQTADLEFKDASGVVLATGNDLKPNAVFKSDQQGRVNLAFIEFKDPQFFANICQKELGKPLSIYLDGKLLMTPIVQTVVYNGKTSITGFTSKQEADYLINSLNGGKLPVPLVEVKK